MKNDFLKDRTGLRRLIRYAEIVVVVILLVYAAFIYRELKMLRAAPVVLPAYWFNAATEAGQVRLCQIQNALHGIFGSRCGQRRQISGINPDYVRYRIVDRK